MDLHAALDRLTDSVEQARAMPMSASALVNRAELLGLLDDVRSQLPTALEDAERLLRDRDDVLARGREEAEQVVAAARAEHDRLVESSAIMTAARERAASVQRAAHEESQRLLAQADDYVDRKLGEFEVALDRLGQQVARGRERLAERRAGQPPPDGDPEQPAQEVPELFDAQAEPTGQTP